MIGRHAPISITVHPGTAKDGESENFNPIDINPGDTISIVGPTGSGKTAFINDIEVFAQGDTVTKRKIRVNGEVPPEEFVRDPARKPIAMITQNTKCLADLTAGEFLRMHAEIRENFTDNICTRTLELANEFTGEKIDADFKMSSLSGGQTRSLMIADAVLISDTPILLLDEIENAGIFKDAVISRLRSFGRAVIFVTHDPYVSMLSDRRIVMRGGEVISVLRPGDAEKEALAAVRGMDETLSDVRERIRAGEIIGGGSA
ncbi:MAG: ATP-binding cassette domain-containing protein [Candidatus Methanoplasma sp.]|jgi:ABC-type lipoprotein export system ATPase subunit|nr:ATP-binding cassette domain-containing protein [Candidatus Methanoplasma sp.]